MSIDYRPNQLPNRRKAFVDAWTEYAATESFAGMTLEEFKTATLLSISSRDELEVLSVRLAGLKQQRDLADLATRDLFRRVANSMRGHDVHGENSSLYRAVGFIPMSERSSGLTRKGRKGGSPGPAAPPPDAPASAV